MSRKHKPGYNISTYWRIELLAIYRDDPHLQLPHLSTIYRHLISVLIVYLLSFWTKYQFILFFNLSLDSTDVQTSTHLTVNNIMIINLKRPTKTFGLNKIQQDNVSIVYTLHVNSMRSNYFHVKRNNHLRLFNGGEDESGRMGRNILMDLKRKIILQEFCVKFSSNFFQISSIGFSLLIFSK